MTKRLGRFDLSLLAADRAARAAEVADDALRLGVARWNLAHVLLADGLSEDAEMVAMRAADALRPLIAEGGAETAAVYGALLLLGAAAVARQGNRWTAHSRLREVAPLADQTGECNTLWTAFGPTNVAMYAVTVEIEAGEVVEGLRLAEQIDQRYSPSIERRVAFLVDQAKGYESAMITPPPCSCCTPLNVRPQKTCSTGRTPMRSCARSSNVAAARWPLRPRSWPPASDYR